MTPYTDDDMARNLHEALAAGDKQSIDDLVYLIDQGEQAAEAVPLVAAALWYAEQGIPIFPLRPGKKSPLPSCTPCYTGRCTGPEVCGHDLCHGLKDATTDVDKVRRWWGDHPDANIGVATGHAFDVVDIDGPLGQASRSEHWDDIFAKIDADSIAKVLTPRPGGMHAYVPATGDGNAAGIVPGVDYRGRGGYVVAPPSVILPGGKDHPGSYRFLGAPNFPARRAAA